MDEPTRGIDVEGQVRDPRAHVDGWPQNGLAILMISSEAAGSSGHERRVLVMNGGRIVGEIDRADATPERVGGHDAGAETRNAEGGMSG